MRREQNTAADALVNRAIDAAQRVTGVRRRPLAAPTPAAPRELRRALPFGIMPLAAGVAQLARASACHAEGRGFESLHPLQTLSGVAAEGRGRALCRLPFRVRGRTCVGRRSQVVRQRSAKPPSAVRLRPPPPTSLLHMTIFCFGTGVPGQPVAPHPVRHAGRQWRRNSGTGRNRRCRFQHLPCKRALFARSSRWNVTLCYARSGRAGAEMLEGESGHALVETMVFLMPIWSRPASLLRKPPADDPLSAWCRWRGAGEPPAPLQFTAARLLRLCRSPTAMGSLPKGGSRGSS